MYIHTENIYCAVALSTCATMCVYHYVCVPKCIYIFAGIYVHVYCVYKKGCATMCVCHYVRVPLCTCAIMYVCQYAYTHLLAYLYIYTVYIHSTVALSSPSPSLFFSLSLSHTHSPIHISRSQLLGSRQIVIADVEVVFVGLSLLSPSHTRSFVNTYFQEPTTR